MEKEASISISLLNLLLNTPSDLEPIKNPQMRNYLDSLATFIKEEANDVDDAANLIRERKVDFED